MRVKGGFAHLKGTCSTLMEIWELIQRASMNRLLVKVMLQWFYV